MTTGFPLPSGYGSPASIPQQGSGLLWQLRNPPRDAPLAPARTRPGTGGAGQPTGGSSSSDLVPVFRAAPYSAEAARLRRPSPTARVLFLDDGCGCRAVLAQALMHAMLRCALRGEGCSSGACAGRRAGRVPAAACWH